MTPLTRRTFLRAALAAFGAAAVQPVLDAFAIEKPKRYWRGTDLSERKHEPQKWYDPRNGEFGLCGVDVGGEGGAKWTSYTNTDMETWLGVVASKRNHSPLFVARLAESPVVYRWFGGLPTIDQRERVVIEPWAIKRIPGVS